MTTAKRATGEKLLKEAKKILEIDPLAARLRNLNPWKELDWPEVVNKAAERIAALEGSIDKQCKIADNLVEKGFELIEQREAAEARLADALAALAEVDGCFQAAFAEGLSERLTECEDVSAGSLHDLLQRRILFAHNVVAATLSRLTAEQKGGDDV